MAVGRRHKFIRFDETVHTFYNNCIYKVGVKALITLPRLRKGLVVKRLLWEKIIMEKEKKIMNKEKV